MSDAVRGLSPVSLWEHFSRISSIPRPSRKEQQVAQFILDAAAAQQLTTRRDHAGNFVVHLPASPGKEKSPCVILQSHLDMVCEKRHDVVHDFDKEPIRMVRDGDYVMADGTTLGADNGIGVAAMMSVMTDPALIHGPMELLFTVDEETGLNGVAALDPALISGRMLVNLDSEEEGTLYIGCAGSRTTSVSVAAAREKAPRDFVPLQISLGGLQGGHSGLEIDKVRGNAIRLLERALWDVVTHYDVRLSRFSGGTRRNSIPREAEALLFVPAASLEDVRKELEKQSAIIWDEWGPCAEPHVSFTIAGNDIPTDGTVLLRPDQGCILSLLRSLPTWVVGMSAAMPGSVETSLNLAVVRTEERRFVAEISMRSSVETALDDIVSRVTTIGHLVGAEVETTTGYPAWRPNPSSPLLKSAADVYRSHFGTIAVVKAIHGGLECAVIGRKVPGIDMISFGPNIEGAHSPVERVNIASVEKFWQLLAAVLERLT